MCTSVAAVHFVPLSVSAQIMYLYAVLVPFLWPWTDESRIQV
jgi:hypothetical protein